MKRCREFLANSSRVHARFTKSGEDGPMQGVASATRFGRNRHPGDKRMLTRRRFLLSAFGAAAAATGYAALVEPFWIDVVHRQLSLPQLPAALRGARLVQLSDVHICSRVSEDFLLSAFGRVKALQPEIVAYTGDFMTLGHDTPQRLARLFPRLPKGRLATVGVLGNHDYGEAWRDPTCAAAIVRLADDAGIRILRNEVAHVHGLALIGLDDLWAGRSKPAAALAGVDLTRPNVVLSHNPDSVDVGDWRGYRGWIISGHTHGGQCKPPFLPAPLLPVRNRRYTAGEISLPDGRTLYINRGLGYLHQVRFNVRPEITVFTLI
jgi:uncharacterized protein